jgi:alkylation response protein AidB-like acyl-CoA dehydrogenase
VDFELTDAQRAWRARATDFAEGLGSDRTAVDVVRAASAAGLLEPGTDLLAAVVALDAIASVAAGPAMTIALHLTCSLSGTGDEALTEGRRLGALTLATDEVPVVRDQRLHGRATWVAPLSRGGVALVGARRGDDLMAYAVNLDAEGVHVVPVAVSGLRMLVMGHLDFTGARGIDVGPTRPTMVRARILIAAVGLGIARRAVREALARARGTSRGAGGEQTVQGLIADAAVDLDAALLLTWKAAASTPSLAAASMAKLAATLAAQRAVERAAQVVGADAFRDGHILGSLTEDVRALELFAGRTEALRDAVALEHLQ